MKVHGSAGNTSTTKHRRAVALRYMGDDVVYDFAERTAYGFMAYLPEFLKGQGRG